MITFALVGHCRQTTLPGLTGCGAQGGLVAKDGTYSVSLAPGVYTVNWVYISAVPRHVGQAIEPSTVIVVAGQNRRLDFRIDTGIR
jgi:hypothetical protein